MEELCRAFSFPRDVAREELEALVARRAEELAGFARRGVAEARTQYLLLIAREHRWKLRRGREVVEEPRASPPVWTDFPPVVMDEHHVPTQTFAPPTRHSYYRALHDSDAVRFPLSRRVFRTRYDVQTHGAPFMGSTWRVDVLCTPQLHLDPSTGRTRVHALVVNEHFEPRWGTLFCTDCRVGRREFEWQQDLTAHPVTVFVRLVGEGPGYRYCGEWTFERLNDLAYDAPFVYLKGQRARLGVFRVTLARYDARWDDDEATPDATS